MRTVWIVSEGSPGHDSQSEGLVAAMSATVPVSVHRLKGRLTAPGWCRPLVLAWMGKRGRPLSERWLQRVTELSAPRLPPPDLVVSSGGKSVFAARTLAARHGAPYVYLGEQKRFPDAWFDVIVSPVPDDVRENAVQLELLPTPVTPAGVDKAAAAKQRPDGRVWLLVVGGASRSHRYTDTDWNELANGMNALAEKHGIRWLVSTSRRTGATAESLLKDGIGRDCVADAIWWSQEPRKELHAFLGMAEVVFVTQDSVTMVSEAVSSGRPTVVVHPRDVRFPKGSFLPAYFAKLEESGRIARTPMCSVSDFALEQSRFDPLREGVLDRAANEVLERLGWAAADAETT